ncbi:hypothetical protein EYF80_021765 [Liparis tanakae]|uniref:Uncharacterized protein n=1 Tax=Liparis tanakae TaxID=230148 RepID=A0A4Z2HSL4_9TELE|nr:hypothetical protein EYF80_021765 [Liparis tanakae]
MISQDALRQCGGPLGRVRAAQAAVGVEAVVEGLAVDTEDVGLQVALLGGASRDSCTRLNTRFHIYIKKVFLGGKVGKLTDVVHNAFVGAGRDAAQVGLGSEEGEEAALLSDLIRLSWSQVLQRGDGRIRRSSAPKSQLVVLLLASTLEIRLRRLLGLQDSILQHHPLGIVFVPPPELRFLKFAFAVVTRGAGVLCVHLLSCSLHQKVTLVRRFHAEFGRGVGVTL